MDLRDTLSSLLPAPRDDEPTTLRQDIIDELSDHLANAYRRELLNGADSNLARQRVLDRFGNPAAVARRLWLDAMKGKIMAQRVLITSCLAVALACISLVGLVYVQSNRAAAQAAEANRKLSEALAHSQRTNDTMLSRLSEMSDAIRHPRSPDWNPLRFTLTEDTPGGPPSVGSLVRITLDESPWARRTDKLGVADFGLVHPNHYTFEVSTYSDRGNWSASGFVNVDPGSQVNHRIVCPGKAVERVPLRVRCDWPTDLDKEGLALIVPLMLMPIDNEGMSWNLRSDTSTGGRPVFVGPRAALEEILGRGPYLWAAPTPPQLRADVMTSDVRSVSEPAQALIWERGTYYFYQLYVVRPFHSAVVTAGRQRFEVLVRCGAAISLASSSNYEVLQGPPTDDQMRSGVGGLFGPHQKRITVESLNLSVESWSKIATPFEARPDRVNQWTITLPDELIKAVRTALKATGVANANPARSTSAVDGK
jgi:hypothetical protein